MEKPDGNAPAILFRLLGPLQLEAGAGKVTFSGRQGALLAALLLQADRVVSTQRLAEAIWAEPLPSGAASRVRMLVSEVRRACAALGAPVIHTQRPGYLVRLGPARLDLACFQDQIALARQAPAEQALGHYDEALRWWRGAPLAGITGSYAETQAEWLDGLRLDALEERLSVLLALGRTTDVVTEARALSGEAPFRERLHEQLMQALYESGRPSEALEVYRQFRCRLVNELGLEPTDELQQLQHRILRSEANPRRPHRQDGPPALPVPSQLPAAPASFTNRSDELAELDRRQSVETGHVGVTVISGPGGSGKTWLALHWAHTHRDRYPDGQLYANLRGFDAAEEPVPPGTVLRHFLTALGVPPAVIPDEQEARAALYRSVLADRRVLIVLDNARDSAQVTPLIPGRPGCTVLVTSRNRLVSLHTTHDARLLEVGAFSDEEARRMLAHHFGPDTMAADPDSVAVLLKHTGGLPLALGVLAARATAHPGFPLAVLARELRDPATRLDALQTGDLGADLRAVFASSYAALDPPAARLFLLLGTVPGPEIGLPAAAALAGLPPAATRTLISMLETATLIRQHAPRPLLDARPDPAVRRGTGRSRPARRDPQASPDPARRDVHRHRMRRRPGALPAPARRCPARGPARLRRRRRRAGLVRGRAAVPASGAGPGRRAGHGRRDVAARLGHEHLPAAPLLHPRTAHLLGDRAGRRRTAAPAVHRRRRPLAHRLRPRRGRPDRRGGRPPRPGAGAVRPGPGPAHARAGAPHVRLDVERPRAAAARARARADRAAPAARGR
ncbi:AfsR/SARP family transcriptional regulator [Nonomuraea salmonea]|uniref:AfsR/SARP family transcriptional regulator n=1 Tax=Nonomuraea salmonea TaxID=46181 RepID=UPI002FEC3141